MNKPIHQIDKPMGILKHEMACGRLARELTEKIDAVLALESELNELIEQASLTVHDCSSSDVVGFDMFNAEQARDDAESAATGDYVQREDRN